MSDSSYFTVTLDTDGIKKMRTTTEANFALSRRKTELNYTSGPQTLSGNGDLVRCDATVGAFTVNLPTSPADGDTYEIVKTDASANAVTVGRNGATINGVASDSSLASQWSANRYTWSDTDSDWYER